MADNPAFKVSDFLRGYLQSKTDNMRDNLLKHGSVATDNLRAGIAFDVKIFPDHVEGTISMPTNEDGTEYWAFIDRGIHGTRGSRAPGSPFRFKNEKVSHKFERSIASWIKAKYGIGKGIMSKPGEYYGMGVSIKRKGIKATHFFSDEINVDTIADVAAQVKNLFKFNGFNKTGRTK